MWADEEGKRYRYICYSCGFERGILDSQFYSTRCPGCKKSYSVEEVIDGEYTKDGRLIINGKPIGFGP